jgi:hypothetical protein
MVARFECANKDVFVMKLPYRDYWIVNSVAYDDDGLQAGTGPREQFGTEAEAFSRARERVLE